MSGSKTAGRCIDCLVIMNYEAARHDTKLCCRVMVQRITYSMDEMLNRNKNLIHMQTPIVRSADRARSDAWRTLRLLQPTTI